MIIGIVVLLNFLVDSSSVLLLFEFLLCGCMLCLVMSLLEFWIFVLGSRCLIFLFIW